MEMIGHGFTTDEPERMPDGIQSWQFSSASKEGCSIWWSLSYMPLIHCIGWIWYAIFGFKDFYPLPLIQLKCPSVSKDAIETT